MFELEEAANAVGIDVVGDGGAAEGDGVVEDGEEGGAEAVELGAGEAAGVAAGPDAGAEEAFVGVDVAHAGEEGLVEEGGFDGGAAAAEEGGKVGGGDGEGLGTGSGEGGLGAEVAEVEAAEAAGIDEAHFATAGEGEAGVGVRGDGALWGGDEEAAGHAEVDDPLGLGWAGGSGGEGADDVFADAADGEDDEVFEAGCLGGGGSGEGFGVGAEPGFADAVPLEALVDAAGDGFDFGQFGHCWILVDGCRDQRTEIRDQFYRAALDCGVRKGRLFLPP